MFTHLHVHTEYSLFDGFSRLKEIVHRTSELNMDSLAITDHGGLYGAVDFYKFSKEANIKPIIGCEVYVAKRGHLDKTFEDKTPYHLTLLARNSVGYKNLVKLLTTAHLDGFYYKPRIDRTLLEQYHEGITVLSGCPSGEVSKLISLGQIDEAKKCASWFKERFHPHYYLEIMRHGKVENLDLINEGLLQISKELDIPIVATNDSHYTKKEDAPLQDILLCIHTNTNINDAKRLRFLEDSYYIKSEEEMSLLFNDLPEALANTTKISDECTFEFSLNETHMPKYPIPNSLSADDYLKNLTHKMIESSDLEFNESEYKRLEYELEVIKQTGYANYFLVVQDITKFARKEGILFTVRGSAAASITLFNLGITDINPVEHSLVFERFLNPERREMPDIDIDFQDDRRHEIMNYLVSTYGNKNVAQIITFGTLGARASLRDSGRALGMPYAEVDKIAKLVTDRSGTPLETIVNSSGDLLSLYQSDTNVRQLVDTASGLEGLTRHSSTHAAGVVVSDQVLDDFIPLQRTTNNTNMSMTQYHASGVESLGLLKLDILGLSNLTILSNTIELIKESSKTELNLSEIPLNDKKTFELLSSGNTVGVFQLESAGMTKYIKKLKPNSISDLAAMIALYRPGPMEQIDSFIESKHGTKKVIYPDERLTHILEETYGIIVYQDQVLLITQAFAGYSLGEADIVRKAMGKKIPDIMLKERKRFISGAIKQGNSKEKAEQIFDLIEPFAGYAFNKAHSVSYAMVSYWTAYFKANYLIEYMTSLMNVFQDNQTKLKTAIEECRRLQLTVAPPNINSSLTSFSIHTNSNNKQKNIEFGLSSIKNVGSLASNPIIIERNQNGNYTSITDFFTRVDTSSLNRKTIESLIMAGAFDEFSNRQGLLQIIGQLVALGQSETSRRNSGQTSLFNLLGEEIENPLTKIEIPDIIASNSENRIWELELLGIQMTTNQTLDNYTKEIPSTMISSLEELNDTLINQKIELIGQILNINERTTKQNKSFVVATIELIHGSIDIYIWNSTAQDIQELWTIGAVMLISGTLKKFNDSLTIHYSKARRYIEGSNDFTISDNTPVHKNGVKKPTPTTNNNSPLNRLVIRIQDQNNYSESYKMLHTIKQILIASPGKDDIQLNIVKEDKETSLIWPTIKIDANPTLLAQISQILSKGDSVNIQEKLT